MELRGRLLVSNGKLYRVAEMDVSGVLSCVALSEILKSNKSMHRLDPLTESVGDTGLNLIGVEEFSTQELSFLLRINSYINVNDVTRIVGYHSEYNRYLFVVYCINNVIHMIDIGQKDVYGLILNNGKVYLPEDLFDTYNIKENVVKHYPKVNWVRNARFYKMNFDMSLDIVETMGRLFYGMEYYASIELPFVVKCSGGTCYKVKDEGGYTIDSEYSVLTNLKSRDVGLTLLSEYMESYYDYPCIRLSDEELLKVKGILEAYGYGSIYNTLKEFNGIQSNFEIKENEEYVCIRDYGDKNTYSLHRLLLNTVFSVDGIPLYYEIRMYTLCESNSYIVLYSSRSREKCERLLHIKYGNLIRGRLLKLKEYPYEITSVVDTSTTISIRYSLRGSKKVCEGIYNKKFKSWKYLSCFDDSNMDRLFLEVTLEIFDRVACVRNYVQEKYSVYKVYGNRFCLEKHFCIGSASKFQGSRNIIYSHNGDKFLIVKWVDDVNSGMWMFSKKDKSMIKLS